MDTEPSEGEIEAGLRAQFDVSMPASVTGKTWDTLTPYVRNAWRAWENETVRAILVAAAEQPAKAPAKREAAPHRSIRPSLSPSLAMPSTVREEIPDDEREARARRAARDLAWARLALGREPETRALVTSAIAWCGVAWRSARDLERRLGYGPHVVGLVIRIAVADGDLRVARGEAGALYRATGA